MLPVCGLLEPEDLPLPTYGSVVNRFYAVERDGAEKTLSTKKVASTGRNIDWVLIWAGAMQAHYRAMEAQRSIALNGVFVSFFYCGFPATHYGL